MKNYRFCLRVVSMVIGIAFLTFGVIFAVWTVLWSVGLLTIDDDPRPSSSGELIVAVLLVAMGLGLAGLGWRLLCPPSHEIRLTYYPTVDLVRVSVEPRVRGHLIRMKEKAVTRFWPRGGNARKLRISLTQGSIRLLSLNEVERFIADMRATYPNLAAAGRREQEPSREGGRATDELETA